MSVHSVIGLCHALPKRSTDGFLLGLPHAVDSSTSFPLNPFLSCESASCDRQSDLVDMDVRTVVSNSRLRSYQHHYIRIRPRWDIFVIFDTMKLAQVNCP